jgi:hypothetical protein
MKERDNNKQFCHPVYRFYCQVANIHLSQGRCSALYKSNLNPIIQEASKIAQEKWNKMQQAG